jgi:hypothetical protein
MLQIGCFWLGWLLFVLAQAKNSVSSSANSLQGWTGGLRWFQIQWPNLLMRAVGSAAIYATAVHTMAARFATLDPNAIAAIAGYTANGFLYQSFGLLPGLRNEPNEVAPPALPRGPTQ